MKTFEQPTADEIKERETLFEMSMKNASGEVAAFQRGRESRHGTHQ
jgi:hypothetical protein